MNDITIAMLSVSLSHTLSVPAGKSSGSASSDERPQADAAPAPATSGRLRRLRTWVGI